MRIVGGRFRGPDAGRSRRGRPRSPPPPHLGPRPREPLQPPAGRPLRHPARRRPRPRPLRRHRRPRARGALARRRPCDLRRERRHRPRASAPEHRQDPHRSRNHSSSPATPRTPAHGQPHDLVFLDPPYGKGLGEQALDRRPEPRLARPRGARRLGRTHPHARARALHARSNPAATAIPTSPS